MLKTDKNLKLYYSISEVAAMVEENDSTLRFWEREFSQLSPKKVRGIRQYTAEDIETVRLIHSLVKGRGLKIAAARELLKKNKEGVQQATEVIDRLRAIRAELVQMKENLGTIE
ncbi:MAG: MerR family transcriptional regulator [Alloprevotella sp.]|nr:MerR family transcriptional regulator [Bacteroidales bacterium]MDY3943727.1 MerR family transcriptional regulator [Alloprevotella sp.]